MQCCETVASALLSANSCLRELDLSNNELQDSGVEWLTAGVKSPHCKLEILRSATCDLCLFIPLFLNTANNILVSVILTKKADEFDAYVKETCF